MSLKHTINLRVGDWSGDGHGHCKTYTIISNLDIVKLKKAYDNGCHITEVSLEDEAAYDYEDSSISLETIYNLQKFNCQIFELVEKPDPDMVMNISADQYLDAWLFIAKIGNSKFEFEKVNNNKSILNIGGYGLFKF